jgi:hypothetical protein
MASIKLFELGPTRSARVRWMLLEAELPYDSAGNSVELFQTASCLPRPSRQPFRRVRIGTETRVAVSAYTGP